MATNFPAGAAAAQTQSAANTLAAGNMANVAQASEELKYVFGRLGDSMKEFGRAATSTTDSFSKYNSAIRGATDATADLLKNFGLIGNALGALVKVVGALTTNVLAQNDALIKAKDQLNQVGFNSEMTAEQIGAMARQVGYTTKNLDEYISVVRSSGVSLLTLGKNAGSGARAFMQLNAVGLDIQTNFHKVGVSQTDLVKHQAHYVKLMQMTGLQVSDRASNEKELQKASLEYVKNLLVISNLTGEEIEAVKARKEAVAAERHFMLQQAMLSDEAEQLERQGLKEEAAKKRKEIEANDMMAEMITRHLDSADQAGALQAMLTGSYTKLSSGLAATGEDYLGAFATMKDKLMRGSATSAEELGVFMRNATTRTMRQFGTSMLLNQDLRNQVHLSNKGIQVAGQRRAESEKDAAEKLEEARARLETVMRSNTDQIAQDRKIRQENERRASITFENLQRLAAGPISTAFRIFMKGLDIAGRGLFHVFKFFNKEKAAEFEHMFVSSEDVPIRLKELADGIKGTEEDIARQRKLISGDTSMPQTVADYQKRLSDLQIASTADEESKIFDMSEEQKALQRKIAADARKELERLEKHGKLMKELDEYEKKLVILKRKQVFMEERRQMAEFERTGGVPDTSTSGGGTAGTTGATSTSNIRVTQRDLATLHGLKLRPGGGDIHQGDNEISPRLIEVAKIIQRDFPEFSHFNGFNDGAVRDANSKHRLGLAMDFALRNRPTPEEGAELEKRFRAIPGVSFALDEYNKPSAGATGPHFHVEVPGARFGRMPSMINAPSSGQLMNVHPNELIAPLDPNSIIAKLLTASPSEADAILGGRMNNDLAEAIKSGFADLSSKMGDLVTQVQTLNSTEDQILRYTRSA